MRWSRIRILRFLGRIAPPFDCTFLNRTAMRLCGFESHRRANYHRFMQEKFQNKYRVKSARLASWDYSWDGSYFITICSINRELIFGEIENGEMILSPIGEIVQQEWDRSFQIRNELFCDAFVLMPNHLHAIVRIENPVETHGHSAETHGHSAETHDHPVETHGCASLRGDPHDQTHHHQNMALPIVRQNPFRHLLRDLNHPPQNELIRSEKHRGNRSGNHGFMIILSDRRKIIIEYANTSNTILKNGMRIDFT